MELSAKVYAIIIILLFFHFPGSTVKNILKMKDANLKLIGCCKRG